LRVRQGRRLRVTALISSVARWTEDAIVRVLLNATEELPDWFCLEAISATGRFDIGRR